MNGVIEFYSTCIPHSDLAVLRRYGVISLVNSPPYNHNCAHALSCMYKSKLNQMGESWLQNKNAVDLEILICMAQMHHSKRNKTCQNSFKIYGGVHFTALVFHTQIWQFPDVTELFHWLTQPHRATTVQMHCPACTKVN